MLGAPQSGIAGIPGADRQMLPGFAGFSSMLGQKLNRANMNPMQCTAMSHMGPMGTPKLMAEMDPYTNQQQPMQLQQQQLHQLQQQLHQLQLHQQQQLQVPPQQPTTQQVPPPQQQETVVSPPQVGSPSAMTIPQVNPAPPPPQQQQQMQQPSPQQMNQRTPMGPQMSSGAMHAMSTGSLEACPASPQLSSQTLGSVGSITNSPMELQGVNKSNSVS